MRVDIRGIAMHYVQHGEGPRTALLLHGAPGDHRQLTHLFEPIFETRAGWRRIYPDMPGMGQTRASDAVAGQDDMLDVALDFADAVAPGEPLCVIGNSWGGYIALGIAQRRPERLAGLMLLAPMVSAQEPDVPTPHVLVREPGVTAAVQPDEANWLRVAPVQTHESLATFRATIKPGLQSADPELLARLHRRWALSTDPPRPAEPLECPALIVTARQDPMVGFRDAWALLEQLPRATYAALDRAGHGVGADQRVVVRALVSEWLDRVEEGATPG